MVYAVTCPPFQFLRPVVFPGLVCWWLKALVFPPRRGICFLIWSLSLVNRDPKLLRRWMKLFLPLPRTEEVFLGFCVDLF